MPSAQHQREWRARNAPIKTIVAAPRPPNTCDGCQRPLATKVVYLARKPTRRYHRACHPAFAVADHV